MFTLLCHDDTCRGHGERAGADPSGACGFCGAALQDALGELLLLEPPAVPAPVADTDLRSVAVCALMGHVWEGVYDWRTMRLRGRCARCALAICTTG